MADLLGSSGDESDDQVSIKINEDYAKNYKRFREKEVFQRLKSKYGEEVAEKKLREAESDSEDSSSEDESAEELTDQVEKDFFKTLACLKSKDPRIYDGKTKFFSESGPSSKAKEKKDKPMFLSDLERKVMLEKGGKYDEMDDFEEPPVTYQQELEAIKSSFKSKLESDSEDDGEGGGLLQKKEKSKVEAEKEDEDYRTWLAGQKDHLSDEQSKADLKPLRDFWTNDKLDENEKFLRDYILNQKFRKRDDDDDDSDSESDNLSEDEQIIQQQEEFEVKYNFRFEEPDQDFIKRYPRTIKDSMRQEANSRKTKRLEVKDRKEREKEKKREEIKQLKALKRKEIMEKLDKLKKIAGAEDLGLNEDDLEEDFDPEKYDKRMKELFESYDSAIPDEKDMEKPEFSDLDSDLEAELEVENWDDWDGNDSENGDDEDGEQPENESKEEARNRLSNEMVEMSRKRKRKSKFAEMIERKKPLFDPNDKTFEEYINEYYGLDFEDLVGDLPCRFRYRKVEDNDFGLSAHEVLSAPDSELNAWCSLRKTCQVRSAQEEKKDKLVYKSKANNIDLKKKILPSLYSEDAEEKLLKEQEKKSSRSKKRRKRKHLNMENKEVMREVSDPTKPTNDPSRPTKRKLKSGTEDAVQEVKKAKLDSQNESKRKKRRRKKKADVQSKTANFDLSAVLGNSKPIPDSKASSKKQKQNVKGNKKDKVNAEYSMSDERLKAYGLNPRKLKRKLIANSMVN